MKNKKTIFIAISLIFFVILGFLYANPVLSGKQLFQHDIIQYKGGAKELLDYRAEYGKETYWSDSMFGGMPTYQMGAQFRGDLIKQVDRIFLSFPKPVNYLFLLFSGFFLLGMVVVKNWKYALLGATFFGLSTYFYIIIAAGHNGKLHTIAYFAPLLAGILLVYIRKKYIWGFIVTTLFMGLQITANHPQMTYYLFLALGFLFISELVRAFQKKTTWKHFFISTGIVGLACVLGVGMNAQRMMANSEYVTETVRGKQILNTESQSAEKSGMDKESMLMWSYGKMETLNLFIPRLMGGGSSEKGTEYRMEKIQALAQQNISSQEEANNLNRGLRSLSYWGEQPGTSGPAYQGAVVVFLAILGFFFAPKKYRYWILGASILTILLAWGRHFMVLSDFFIDFVPFYNKFRAPSSILVVVELLFPLIAIIGLYQFFNTKKITNEQKQKTLFAVGGSIIGITLLLVLFGKNLLGFSMEVERAYLPSYILNYLVDERQSDFNTDAFKAIAYILIVIGAMFLALKNKLNKNIALVIIGLVSLFDLWTVNQRYLNNDNFVDKTLAENPFQTEITPLIVDKVGDNRELQSVLANAKVNATLQKIKENDPTHYRVYNQAINPFGETNTSYFVSSVGGYHGVKLRRYDDLINEYFTQMDTVRVPKVLNLLNTKYMIFGDTENFQPVPNPYANGNAWFVSDIQFVKTPNEEIKLIGEVDTKKTAIIAEKDKVYFDNKPIEKDSTAHIQLTDYKANELSYKSISKTPQLAVFSEIYYPKGWKVLVDGKETDYIKVDYLLRAVHLPAGEHTIKMMFDPEVIHKGKIVSMICFILFLVLSGLGIFMLFRKEKSKEIV
ncbi:MAG: hypothetical protein CSA38_02860 [Flavobacteriales bacterium]|nr:MAG: hypothetical protein CSA38_02860 [Flavobacteriales bacterium]